MDWLDSLLGRKKPAAEPAAPRKVTLDELEQMAGERRKALFQPAVQQCTTVAREIQDALRDGAAVAAGLKDKHTDQKMPQYRIGEQMRLNFSSRAPPILGIAGPEGDDFASFEAFHSRALAAMAQATKVVSDNRYLFGFFKQDMEEFARAMKRAGAFLDGLQRVLQARAPEIRECGQLEALCRDARTAGQEVEEARNRLEAAEKASSEARAGAEAAKAVVAEQERLLGEARTGLEAARNEEGLLRTSLAGILQPLSRPLRKLEHVVLEREAAAAINAYAESPVQSLLEEVRTSGDCPRLRLVLDRLADGLAKGQVEPDAEEREKITARARQAASEEMLEKARKLLEAGQKTGEAEAQLQKKERGLASEKARLAQLERAAGGSEAAREALRQAEAQLQAKISALNERAAAVLGEKVEVVMPSGS